MSELVNLVWTEKYRPKSFEDIIFNDKKLILNYLKTPQTLPNFIFHSSSPGTGKTSLAKIICNYLNCDNLIINSSMERGIDVIREEISLFVRTVGINNIKKCIFLDESDGITKIAQDSMRNLMETYSENCFFIFSCNDLNKIIEPIRSRCSIINFEKPDKTLIMNYLMSICEKEGVLEGKEDELPRLVETFYPDIRSMIGRLQQAKIDNKSINYDEKEFEDFLELIKNKKVMEIYEKVYSSKFEIMSFNKWFFDRIFLNYQKLGLEKASAIALKLADTEKSWNIGANIEVVFISNILEIMKIL